MGIGRRGSDAGIPVNISSSASCPNQFMNEVAGGTNWEEDDWEACEVVIDRGDPAEGGRNNVQIPRSTTDHIAAYRQAQHVARQKSEEKEVESDLFSDMVPKIKKQKKIFVGQTETAQNNRLS